MRWCPYISRQYSAFCLSSQSHRLPQQECPAESCPGQRTCGHHSSSMDTGHISSPSLTSELTCSPAGVVDFSEDKALKEPGTQPHSATKFPLHRQGRAKCLWIFSPGRQHSPCRLLSVFPTDWASQGQTLPLIQECFWHPAYCLAQITSSTNQIINRFLKRYCRYIFDYMQLGSWYIDTCMFAKLLQLSDSLQHYGL